VVERVVVEDPVGAAADLHCKLGLRVDVRCLGRDDDRLAGVDEGVLELAKISGSAGGSSPSSAACAA